MEAALMIVGVSLTVYLVVEFVAAVVALGAVLYVGILDYWRGVKNVR